MFSAIISPADFFGYVRFRNFLIIIKVIEKIYHFYAMHITKPSGKPKKIPVPIMRIFF